MSKKGGGRQRGGGGGRGDGGQGRGQGGQRGQGRGGGRQARGRCGHQQQHQPGGQPSTQQQQYPMLPAAPPPAQSPWGVPRQQASQQQQPQQYQPLQAAPPPAQSAWGVPRPQVPQQPPQQPYQQPMQVRPPPIQQQQMPQQDQQQLAPSEQQPAPSQQQPQKQGQKQKKQKQGAQQHVLTEQPAPSEQQPAPSQQPRPQQPKQKQAQQQQPQVSPTKGGGDLNIRKAVQDISTATGGTGVGDGVKGKEVIAKGGKRGFPIEVYTNHFEMDVSNLKNLVYQYDVAIDPDRPKKQMRAVMEEFKKQHYPKSNPAFDGSKILFSAGRLPFGAEKSGTIKLLLDERVKEYKVVVKEVQEIDMSAIAHFYAQVGNGVVTDAPMINMQVIDVVLRHSLALRQIVVGNSLFTIPRTDRTINLGNGMHMYRGMYQSAIMGWRPFLNIDVANKAFPSATNIIDLIKEFGGRYPPDLNANLHSSIMDSLRKHLRTLRVQYEIPRNASSKRNYRVNGVESNSMDYIFEHEGRNISVVTYYANMKGYNIRYPKMPLLWVGSMKNKVMVPCELCTVLPGQPVNRKCDAIQTQNMIRQCATDTDRRMKAVVDNVRNANYNADAVVREFGLRISDQMEQVEARILDPPTIRYKMGTERVDRGVWMPRQFYVSGQIHKGWTILNLDRYVKLQDLQKLVQLVQSAGRVLGMNMDAYKPIGPNADCEVDDLKEVFNGVKRRGLDLVFVVLPGNNDRMYACVKLASEVAVGCLTQCIKSKTLQTRMNNMTMKNILMKVNAKLAGSNHIFQNPPGVMINNYTMLMGADVTHPSPDVRDGFSVAAVTASHNPNAFNYNICWRLQPPGQEIIVDMQNITRTHLLRFYRQNGMIKPNRIIMFRDGVSTGQFEAVLRAELQAIRRACTSLEPAYQPSVTFIVVQKRHHTRFFPVDRSISQDKNNNVPAGTIVDKTITHPTRQDFYLVSHASIQGVAKPTKYVTLWDDNDISDDSLEELTYYLCHMFSRCTRSVSYPAPTYYAHLAAARGKAYCDGKGHINTSNLEREQNELQVQTCIIEGKPMFFV